MTRESEGKKRVVLVIEDEPLIMMHALAIVEDAGFTALEAANADKALSILESRDDIWAVFTDVDMPAGSMDGLKLAHAVRKRWPPIHFIVTSGHKSLDERDLPSGGRFFRKPYEALVIAQALRDLAA